MLDSMPKMKPRLYLSSEDLPEIKDWDTGETYRVEVEIKMTSKSEDLFGKENKRRVNGSFDIESVEVESDEDEEAEGEDDDEGDDY